MMIKFGFAKIDIMVSKIPKIKSLISLFCMYKIEKNIDRKAKGLTMSSVTLCQTPQALWPKYIPLLKNGT